MLLPVLLFHSIATGLSASVYVHLSFAPRQRRKDLDPFYSDYPDLYDSGATHIGGAHGIEKSRNCDTTLGS
jgi:hypothetical protein